MVRRIALASLALLFSHALVAANFTVNSTVDATDANPGDGVCETAAGNGLCTLRAAIQETNALGGTNSIALPAGTYAITIAGAAEKLSATGSFDVLGNLTITGAGSAATIIDGGGAAIGDLVFELGVGVSGKTMTLSQLAIQNAGNTAVFARGGNTQNFDHVLFTNNTKYGALFSDGTVYLTDSTFTGNVATSDGGGIHSQGPLMVIDRCTINGNTAAGGGGGMYVGAGEVDVINSTFTGNHAVQGGGISSQGTVRLRNVTVVNNSATTLNAGGLANFGTFDFANSIIAGNTAGGGQPDCGGNGSAFTSLGYTLIENPSNCTITGTLTGDLSNIAPQLGTLANNGGPTQTILPIGGSPVLNAGDPAGCYDATGAALTIDQRGLPRPVGARCDMGAVEAALFAKGDVNGDGSINAGDVFYLTQYLFAGGSAPVGSADVNGDGAVTAGDVFYLINYIFAGGTAPK